MYVKKWFWKLLAVHFRIFYTFGIITKTRDSSATPKAPLLPPIFLSPALLSTVYIIYAKFALIKVHRSRIILLCILLCSFLLVQFLCSLFSLLAIANESANGKSKASATKRNPLAFSAFSASPSVHHVSSRAFGSAEIQGEQKHRRTIHEIFSSARYECEGKNLILLNRRGECVLLAIGSAFICSKSLQFQYHNPFSRHSPTHPIKCAENFRRNARGPELPPNKPRRDRARPRHSALRYGLIDFPMISVRGLLARANRTDAYHSDI